MGWTRIALGIVGGLAAVGIVGSAASLALFPKMAHVERSVLVQAPACNVHAVLAGMDCFNDWSPWATIDAAGTTYTYEGPAYGEKSAMRWRGVDPRVGSGGMEVLASAPCTRVDTRIDFEGEGSANASYLLSPDGAGTRVTWTFDVDMGNNPIGRFMGSRMDGLVGPDFARGLARLKTLVESLPQADVAGLIAEPMDPPTTPALVVHTTSAADPEARLAAVTAAQAQVAAYGAANGLRPGGAPAVQTEATPDGTWAITALFPVRELPAVLPPPTDPAAVITAGATPTGPSIRAVYEGPYAGLGDTEAKLAAWMAIHRFEPAGPAWESWVSDPAGASPVVHVFVPLKAK